jgi:RNA polymerase sigma factor (sigma-70 family)
MKEIKKASKSDESYVTRKTLLAKIKNKHDDASWEDFVYYYKSYIYIICRKKKLSHHDAEDVVQKVLMVAWKKLPDFEYDSKQNFRGWLFGVTIFGISEFYRYVNRQNSKVEKASNNQPENIYNEPVIEVNAEIEWKKYIANMALDNIKDKFSEKVIEVFTKLSEGVTRSSVADEMDLPPNTVSVYKKRVTAMMHKEIRRLNRELGEV